MDKKYRNVISLQLCMSTIMLVVHTEHFPVRHTSCPHSDFYINKDLYNGSLLIDFQKILQQR